MTMWDHWLWLPPNRYARAMLGACVALASSSASADGTTPPSPTPPSGSAVMVFIIEPEQSDQTFMCANGRVQSVLATAIAEHRVVSVVFVDQSKAPIQTGVWSAAYGFRLLHPQSVKIEATMICGG